MCLRLGLGFRVRVRVKVKVRVRVRVRLGVRVRVRVRALLLAPDVPLGLGARGQQRARRLALARRVGAVRLGRLCLLPSLCAELLLSRAPGRHQLAHLVQFLAEWLARRGRRWLGWPDETRRLAALDLLKR